MARRRRQDTVRRADAFGVNDCVSELIPQYRDLRYDGPHWH